VPGYAFVSYDGTVAVAQTLNVTSSNVVHVRTGIYCFVGLPFTPKIAMASASGNPLLFITNTGSDPFQLPGYCPGISNPQAVVGIANGADVQQLVDAPFYVMFN
jgi:hypothetical protein